MGFSDERFERRMEGAIRCFGCDRPQEKPRKFPQMEINSGGKRLVFYCSPGCRKELEKYYSGDND